MNQYLSWLKNNPSGVTTLSTALISATVAIILLVLSQWVLSRRNRTEFLTKKLEELYLMIYQISEHNWERFELLVKLARGETKYDESNAKETRRIYNLFSNKKIVMLIRLYFPKLASTHQAFSQVNSRIDNIIFDLNNSDKPMDSNVEVVLFEFEERLRSLEEEIIQNKDILVESNLLPRIYKSLCY
ncbi:MAG: hypothetical protein NTY00_02765 [Deltaproteobacteria bacterium]|nr:hypothetical protein [Deltaproteobacteria bacterium]